MNEKHELKSDDPFAKTQQSRRVSELERSLSGNQQQSYIGDGDTTHIYDGRASVSPSPKAKSASSKVAPPPRTSPTSGPRMDLSNAPTLGPVNFVNEYPEERLSEYADVNSELTPELKDFLDEHLKASSPSTEEYLLTGGDELSELLRDVSGILGLRKDRAFDAGFDIRSEIGGLSGHGLGAMSEVGGSAFGIGADALSLTGLFVDGATLLNANFVSLARVSMGGEFSAGVASRNQMVFDIGVSALESAGVFTGRFIGDENFRHDLYVSTSDRAFGYTERFLSGDIDAAQSMVDASTKLGVSALSRALGGNKAFSYDLVDQLGRGKTLLLGEGNLSFSKSLLGNSRINLKNITSTTYEPSASLASDTLSNKVLLENSDVRVLHGVDATDISGSLGKDKFDTIAFNFPHTGKRPSQPSNRALLRNFFTSAQSSLQPGGKVVVTLKDSPHYKGWRIEEQANFAGLKLVDRSKFNFDDFPEFNHTQTKKHGTSAQFSNGAVTYTFEVAN